VFTVDEFLAARKAQGTSVSADDAVSIENTQNRMGGIVFPQASERSAPRRGRATRDVPDGARVWNAAIASGRTPANCRRRSTWSGRAVEGTGAPGGIALAVLECLDRPLHRYRR
jgi:threonine aldolase